MNKKKEPEPKPKIIGLTGGIGSGKTTVADVIEQHGYAVYYSDTRAKEIVNDNLSLKNQIIDLLGSKAYTEDGSYNRKWVAEQIFNNDELLQQLNQLIHPAVKLDFEDWVSQQDKSFIFKETALLFELKLHEQCYRSVLITAEDNIRMKRVMDRDQKTYREVESIMNKQMPEKLKIKKADFIIYNNTTIEELKSETEKFLQELENLEN